MILPLLLFSVVGCMANNGLTSEAMSAENISNLSRISVGMDQSRILKIMRQPYFHETYIVGKDIYDVWFYVTRTTVLGQSRMVPLNLTPLTFKNGSLIGWGYSHYNALFKQKKQEAPPPPPPTEDIKLEKALEEPKHELSISKASPQEEEGKTGLDESDDQMIEEADEQNFDFW